MLICFFCSACFRMQLFYKLWIFSQYPFVLLKICLFLSFICHIFCSVRIFSVSEAVVVPSIFSIQWHQCISFYPCCYILCNYIVNRTIQENFSFILAFTLVILVIVLYISFLISCPLYINTHTCTHICVYIYIYIYIYIYLWCLYFF